MSLNSRQLRSFLGQGTGMEYRSKNYSVVQSLEGKWKWSNRLRRPQQKGQGAQPTCRRQGSRARDRSSARSKEEAASTTGAGIRIFAALAYLSRMRKVAFDRVSRRAEPKFLPGRHDG